MMPLIQGRSPEEVLPGAQALKASIPNEIFRESGTLPVLLMSSRSRISIISNVDLRVNLDKR